MNTQKKREKLQKKRRQQVARQKLMLLLILTTFISVGSVACSTFFCKAKNPASDVTIQKYYKSITIEQGDSLWSIAQEYRTEDYDNTQEYIDELMQINGLTSETIHEGQHLIIVY